MKISGINPTRNPLRAAAAAESLVKQEVTKAHKKRRRARIGATQNQRDLDSEQQTSVTPVGSVSGDEAVRSGTTFSRHLRRIQKKSRASKPKRGKKVEAISTTYHRFSRRRKRGQKIDVVG